MDWLEEFDYVDARLISIVIPVYNEADSLDQLVSEIDTVAVRCDLRTEVIFVDDGSRDRSWPKIEELCRRDSRFGGIRFRANSGKAAALMAGFAAAKGELVFMMDADLQDPPEEMPRFIETIDSGFDVVTGWKRKRFDPWHKVYPSRVFNKMIGWLTGVHLHDNVCGYKCFRREVLDQVAIHGEQHRFLCVLSAAKGFKVTEIATLHRPREHGEGKYGFTRFAKGFLDLLTVWFMTRYGRRPQHLFGVTGLVIALVVVFSLLAGAVGLSGLASMIQNILWIAVPALLFVAVGLIAEMVAARQSPHDAYFVTERVGVCAADRQSNKTDQIKETVV